MNSSDLVNNLQWLFQKLHFAALNPALVAIAAATWPIFQFFATKRSEARIREFEHYHKLIKEIVAPDERGVTYIDRQVAAVFELRRFHFYQPVTIRILEGLKEDWKGNTAVKPRLVREMDLAIAHLKAGRVTRRLGDIE